MTKKYLKKWLFCQCWDRYWCICDILYVTDMWDKNTFKHLTSWCFKGFHQKQCINMKHTKLSCVEFICVHKFAPVAALYSWKLLLWEQYVSNRCMYKWYRSEPMSFRLCDALLTIIETQKAHKTIIKTYFSCNKANAVLWRAFTELHWSESHSQTLHCCFVAICSDVYIKEQLGTFLYFPLLNGLIHLLLFSNDPPAISNQLPVRL